MNAPQFRVTVMHAGAPLDLHFTAAAALALAADLAAGAAQLQAIYGPPVTVQTSALLTREASA